jgi:hypothetical protein
MELAETITYGRLPYWRHNGHTATVTNRQEYDDGTADVTLLCNCGDTWQISEGVDV